MAFEQLFDMSATFESYVDHVQQFPDRVASFAKGHAEKDPTTAGYFEEPTDEHAQQFGRASMLLSPGMAAKSILQWLKNPSLKHGELMPEHLQVAAYLGQHTFRPVTRNEYMNNAEAMKAYWKEWTNLEGSLPLGNSHRVVESQ